MTRQLQKQLKIVARSCSPKEEGKEEDGDGVDEENGEQEQEEASFLPYVRLTVHFVRPDLEHLLPDGDQAPLRLLLRDYLQSSAKAYCFCHSLLRSIDGALAYLRAVRRVVVAHYEHPLHGRSTESRPCTLQDDLARIAQLANPLSNLALAEGSPAADGGVYAPVIPRLRSLQRRVAGRRGFAGLGWMASGLLVVHPCGERRHGGEVSRLSAWLDAAGRGAYALDRDFDTVGRMLARMSDEIEHGRSAVRQFLRGRGGYSWGEVVRRLEAAEAWLLDQLRELEEHVHLCLLIIDRARKLLPQERGKGPGEHFHKTPHSKNIS